MRLVSRILRRPRPLKTSEMRAQIDAMQARMDREWRAKKIADFERRHGYPANLDAPGTFSEKLLKRILEDDDPLLRTYGVKIFARHFVRARGIEGLKLPVHLKVVRRLRPADFDDLPEAFVIKSSFGSGLNEIVADKSALDVAAVCARFNAGLPAARNAQNKRDPDNAAIFEQYLGDPRAGVPNDYKFHCFHRADGSFTGFMQINSGRFVDFRQTNFDRDFVPIDMRFGAQKRHDAPPPAPAALDDLWRIARALSRGFDYVRVDLYEVAGEIYFGELTPFQQGANAPILPFEWDETWGRAWDQRFPMYRAAAPG